MKKNIITLLLLLLSVQLFAQAQEPSLSDSVYASGKIYVVVACAGLILLGILFYLFSIDRRLKKLEKK
ncbi:MAG: CcmD family protein [Bacteroidota bacterium]